MAESRFSEHYRIDQYLRNKSMKILKANTMKRHSNQLSNFPIGLIIMIKEDLKVDYKIDFINQYACRLFKLPEDADLNELKKKFGEFVKLKNNYTTKTSQTLNDIIFNSTSFNLEMDNFVPFECTHSKTSILYIKINDIDGYKYIAIDKYDKYIEEKRFIEFNLIKAINYQYLHTLYHELNNPLNALLALSGESDNFEKSELGDSRIYDNISNFHKKNYQKFKKDKKKGLLSLNLSRKKINVYKGDYSPKKRSIGGDFSFGLNNQIPLLVKIIKVFIKNFILYLKTRADNLLSLKNEYELQNDTSDIMNAVEVSDYEKELTRHKNVKLNLEYILELYLQKYLCLFQYKEIDYETNFEKLKNMYVETDEFNFSYYIRQIYTYLYYVVPKREGFTFEYKEEDHDLKIMIKKKIDENLSRTTDNRHRTSIKDDKNVFRMDQAIQTKEMTKEVLYSMSKKLKFNIEIFDDDKVEQNNYLLITIPIERNEESDINDFKDEDINEMISKESVVLEEKLKRQLPSSNSFLEARNVSNISGIQIVDFLDRSGEEIKSFDFFSSANKSNIQSHNLKFSGKNINLNDSTNELSSIRDNNNVNGSFLSKCIKASTNKTKFNITESEAKVNKEKDKDKERNKLKLRSCFSLKTIKNTQKNDKSQMSDLKSNNSSHKSNGIFTLVDKRDKNSIKFHNIEKQINEMKIDMNKNKNDEMTFKEQSGVISGFGSSIKINENKSINNVINKENISSGKPITSILRNNYFGANNTKMKHSCFASEENGADKNNKNNEIKKNEFILIEIENERKNLNLQKKMNQNISNKLCLNTIKEENDTKIQSSVNMVSEVSNKNGMSVSEPDKKDIPLKVKYTKTVIDSDIQYNRTLFLEAINESKSHIEKRKKKIDNILIGNSQNVESQEESEEDSNYLMHSEAQCNCADLLVVDDEEFNVMASQRMLHKLGFESDAAYDGKECLNLINNKLKLNCKCEHSFYKIIFLDIVMPVMDGIKTAKKIQDMIDKNLLNNKTVIIFISGNINDKKLKNSLLEIKCVKECFEKPVRIEKYQKILEKYYN